MSAETKSRRKSSAAAFPAKASAVLEAVVGSMMTALGCGGNTPDSSKRPDLNGSSSKTAHSSSSAGSSLCSGTLPRSGMLHGGTVCPLPPSALHTSAIDSSSSLDGSRHVRNWPTPVATYWHPKDAALILKRWRGESQERKAKNLPSVGELVYALHGGPVNLNWLDSLMGLPPGWTKR